MHGFYSCTVCTFFSQLKEKMETMKEKRMQHKELRYNFTFRNGSKTKFTAILSSLEVYFLEFLL